MASDTVLGIAKFAQGFARARREGRRTEAEAALKGLKDQMALRQSERQMDAAKAQNQLVLERINSARKQAELEASIAQLKGDRTPEGDRERDALIADINQQVRDGRITVDQARQAIRSAVGTPEAFFKSEADVNRFRDIRGEAESAGAGPLGALAIAAGRDLPGAEGEALQAQLNQIMGGRDVSNLNAMERFAVTGLLSSAKVDTEGLQGIGLGQTAEERLLGTLSTAERRDAGTLSALGADTSVLHGLGLGASENERILATLSPGVERQAGALSVLGVGGGALTDVLGSSEGLLPRTTDTQNVEFLANNLGFDRKEAANLVFDRRTGNNTQLRALSREMTDIAFAIAQAAKPKALRFRTDKPNFENVRTAMLNGLALVARAGGTAEELLQRIQIIDPALFSRFNDAQRRQLEELFGTPRLGQIPIEQTTPDEFGREADAVGVQSDQNLQRSMNLSEDAIRRLLQPGTRSAEDIRRLQERRE